MKGLVGKSAVVTGASKGIGFAIAKALVESGVRTLLVARDREALASKCEELSCYGDLVDFLAGDLSNAELPKSAVDRVRARWGSVDILVNNGGGPPMGGFQEFNGEQWQATIELNLLSVVRFTQAVAPGMTTNGWGRILTISSTVAKEPSPMMVLSATTRAGVAAFTKCVATELAPFGVTANVLCPGGVLTDRLSSLVKARSEREGVSYQSLIEQSVKSIPIGRFAQADELGEVAAFLCSDAGAYITGVCLSIDGGLTKGFT